MQRDLIFGLHGFLGQTQDWYACEKHFKTLADANWITPSLFAKDSLPITSFRSSVEQFISRFEIQKLKAHKKIFVGYSLGGRLGLHFLKKHAKTFDHFIFISTHPGLEDEKLKADRLESDERWNTMLETEPWDVFIKAWNSQPVFAAPGLEPARYEKDFDKSKLQRAMKEWTLGKQESMFSDMTLNQKKISWIVGENDSKFIAIAEDLVQKKILPNFSRISSGHRVPFENPKALALEIQKIIATIA